MFERDVRLKESQVKGVKKAMTNSRGPFYIGVRLIEVSVLSRCPCYRGVRLKEMSVKRESTVLMTKFSL